MIDVDSTDLIAVGNRSHNLFKLFSDSKKNVVLPFLDLNSIRLAV
jgi:hypothetical protein